MRRLLIEIDEEVRAKRASGELPAELERELDMVFARFAPAGAVQGDFDQLLERAQSQAFFDLVAPNESVRPGVPYVKRIVQKSVRWYMRYVVEQITGFAQTIASATRQLNTRVNAVEAHVAPREEFDALHLENNYLDVWGSDIVGVLKSTQGRVLHARCGSGELVKQLRSANVDAYGIDINAELVAIGTAGPDGLDLRPDDEVEHLGRLSASALEGIVLSDCVDSLPRGLQIELAERSAIALAPGGVLVIVSTNPVAWANQISPLQRDLAPGQPMHAETWKYILEERGFSNIEIHHEVSSNGLVAPNSELRESFDKLNALLFPPRTTLIVAKR